MKMPLESTGDLMEHSEAKVQLLSAYLSKYLSVICNARRFTSIDLYDVFCGPGLYGTSSEGSPLVAMRAASEVAIALAPSIRFFPKINFHFADTDSDNIARAEEACKKRHDPSLGSLNIQQRDYRDSLNLILNSRSDPSRKEFIFIDPTGYSDVKPTDIKALLDRGAEVLLFLPIQFMWRFRQKATPEPLQEFVRQLPHGDYLAQSGNAHEYALKLRDLFRNFVNDGEFVSTFMIEKDASTLFGLYFFTPKWQGHLKMIEAKWDVGSTVSTGWSFRNVPGQNSLFGPEIYAQNLVLEAVSNGPKNNVELFTSLVMIEELKPSMITAACKYLAAEGKIETKPVGVASSKQGYYYIGEKYYKGKDIRISVSRI